MKEYNFVFEEFTDELSPFPHVALVTWKWDWHMVYKKIFPYITYTQNDNNVLVVSEYTAQPGDIIEKQTRESRFWYLITENGKEIKVADALIDEQREKISKYLRGEIPKEDLCK